MSGKIFFYEPWDENGYLCNLSPYTVFFDGLLWPTSEHCYQAQKHRDPAYREKVRSASTCQEAIALGRDENSPSYRHDDWMDVRVSLMYDIVYAKFSQHEDIRKMLLDTGDAEIAEHTQNDHFWGDGMDGSGENHLGKVLMEVRSALRAKEEA